MEKNSIVDELTKLKKLLDSEILTQDEFDKLKLKLLNKDKSISESPIDDNDISDKLIDTSNLSGKELKDARWANYIRQNPDMAIKHSRPLNASNLKKASDKTEKKLIKNGAMCPKCKSQDVMVTNSKRKISGVLVLGFAAKSHAQIVCKTCGHTWKQ